MCPERSPILAACLRAKETSTVSPTLAGATNDPSAAVFPIPAFCLRVYFLDGTKLPACGSNAALRHDDFEPGHIRRRTFALFSSYGRARS